jgi:prepilin-type N-terminal cleavage/methylation domain-containing protein
MTHGRRCKGELKECCVIKNQRGFSLVEAMVALSIGAILLAAIMPGFMGLMRTYRRDAAVEQVAGDIRKARSQAIATGWQYRIMGFNQGWSGSSTYKNQYRIMARRTTADGWPADTVAPMKSATQYAGPWIDVGRSYPGVKLNPTDTSQHFSAAFDSRGVRIELDTSLDPLVVVPQSGPSKSIRISAVGSASIQ